MTENQSTPTPKIATSKAQSVTVMKVDDDLGLVFGFAVVSTLAGEPYFDVQGDNIPDEVMLKSSLDFFENARVAKEMHKGDRKGTVVFGFPLTAEIAKSLGIETEKTGLLIGMKPEEGMLEKFRDGTYTGFSIGGEYGSMEVVE